MVVRILLKSLWIVSLCCLAACNVAAQDIRAAVDRGDVNAVKQALRDQGSKAVNDVDSNGATLLHIAANKGSTEIARLLIEAGANVNARGPAGWISVRCTMPLPKPTLMLSPFLFSMAQA